MKSDREFLDGMWDKVSETEYDEIQKKAAKIRNRKIIATNTAIFLSVIIVFIYFIIEKPSPFATYIIAPVLLALAYLLEKFISGENNENNEKPENKSGGIKVI